MTGGFWDLLLRFAVSFLQIHLLGVLYLRLFRPDDTSREGLFHPNGEASPTTLRSFGRLGLRFLKMLVWPLLATALAFVLPKPRDYVDSAPLFGLLLLFMLAFLTAYLWWSEKASPLREAMPVVVLSLLLRGAAESVVQHVLTSPALRGPFVVRFLGLDFAGGTLSVVSSYGGFFQQGANVLLTAILIIGVTSPSLLRIYPKHLRTKVVFLFGAFLVVVLSPLLVYTQILRDSGTGRPFRPGELFGLLLTILVGLSYFFYSVESIRMLERKNRALAEREAELAAQRFYNQQVEPLVDSLRAQRHGHENLLAALAGLVRARDYEGLEQAFAQVSGDHAHLSPVDDKALRRIHSAALLGLLSAKAADARKAGVRFQLKVAADVADLPVPVFTLCEILGVLLDNAIEAAAAVPHPQVRFEVQSAPGTLVFLTTNVFAADTAPDLDRLGEKGYTTKTEGHGLGLHLVRTRLKDLPGVQLNPSLEGGWFSQELLIPVASGAADASEWERSDALA